MDDTLQYNAARWFEREGYTTVRFNLYDWKLKTRKLKECAIRTHADDLDSVVRYIRGRGARTVHVVGHSYGGPTILASRDRDFESVTLWDPTARPTFRKYGARQTRGLYLLPGAWEVVVGKRMFDENKLLNSPKALAALAVPTRVLCAQRSPLNAIWKQWFARLKSSHSFVTVPNASHMFDEDGAQERLFTQTLKWISTFTP